MYMNGDAVRQLNIAETFHWKWRQLEEDMVTWWLQLSEQQTQLKTTENARLIVIDAGSLNDGPGPDILNSYLILDDLELTGPIEMHKNSADWYHHQHHGDPAYNNVILHVVMELGIAPDIPTMILPKSSLGGKFCPARRPVSKYELKQMAEVRFSEKVNHLKQLADNELGLSPLLLGLFEILLSGPQRMNHLQELAVYLGLRAWTHVREWRGSRQTFQQSQMLSGRQEKILANAAFFDPGKWRTIYYISWREWDQYMDLMNSLGISANQTREWVVNILAPFKGGLGGFTLWQDLRTFRSYGHEKRLLIDLGLGDIDTISIQQGVLQWKKTYCAAGNCSVCPLVRSY